MIHTVALLLCGGLCGAAIAFALLTLDDAHDALRTAQAWLDYEKEERAGWKESKTQKERKAQAQWN